MAGCGGCGSNKKIKAYVVKRPGQAPRQVSSEGAAQALVKGVPGATITPQGGTK